MSSRFSIKIQLFSLFVVLISASASPAAPPEATPLATANRGVLVQIFGLPAAEPARLVPAGKTAVAVIAEAANTFTVSSHQATGERLVLDGESYRWTLGVRRRVGTKAELGIEVPFILHGGGFLDGFIDGWHDFFGLPTGDREKVRRGLLTYRHERGGRTLVNLTGSGGGISDLRLTGAWSLHEDRHRAVSLHAGVKLPTGDPDRLTGSGSIDGSLSLAASTASETSFGTFTLFGSAGGLAMTRGDILSDQQKRLVGFGTLGAGWSPFQAAAFTLQLSGNTGFYRSALHELADPSAQLVIGGTLAVDSSTRIDVGVTEDVAVGTSPDVVFHLALRQTF